MLHLSSGAFLWESSRVFCFSIFYAGYRNHCRERYLGSSTRAVAMHASEKGINSQFMWTIPTFSLHMKTKACDRAHCHWGIRCTCSCLPPSGCLLWRTWCCLYKILDWWQWLWCTCPRAVCCSSQGRRYQFLGDHSWFSLWPCPFLFRLPPIFWAWLGLIELLQAWYYYQLPAGHVYNFPERRLSPT